MRESGKGLFCPFLSICLPWMQKVSYLLLWGKCQNFQNFGSAPASIHVFLSCFWCKLFPEMVLLRESMTVMETEEEEWAENQETEFKCWQELAKTILSSDTLSKIRVCTCAELGQLSPSMLAATDSFSFQNEKLKSTVNVKLMPIGFYKDLHCVWVDCKYVAHCFLWHHQKRFICAFVLGGQFGQHLSPVWEVKHMHEALSPHLKGRFAQSCSESLGYHTPHTHDMCAISWFINGCIK